MNFTFLFYGKPCSGKDTLINNLLKRKKQILHFIYLFYNLTEKRIFYKYVEEKILFINLIKYYYRLNNVRIKLSCTGRKRGTKIISFSFLLYLSRCLLTRMGCHPFQPNAYNKLNNMIKKVIRQNKKNKFLKNYKDKYNNMRGKHRYPYNKWNIKKKATLFNNLNKYKMCYTFANQIIKWKKYFQLFMSKNKTCIYVICTDFIEKQFYNYQSKEKKNTPFSLQLKKAEKYHYYMLNEKYIIYEKKKKKKKSTQNVFYPFLKKTRVKNGILLIRKKEKKKKATLINQTKYWKVARKIAYSYCLSLMRREKCKEQHEKEKEKEHHCPHKNSRNKIIILNDTFHLPSMRKKYFLLSKKYNFNYVQVYLNTPLQTCLRRNRNRKNFKYISEKTIVRNHICQQKYAVRLNPGEQTKVSNMINVVKTGHKWQMKILSLQIDSFRQNKIAEILFFIYKHFTHFKNIKQKRKVSTKEEQKPQTKSNPLNLLNVMINKIIHERLKELPNECRDNNTHTIENVEDMFFVQ
ncbi:L-seryl-tRNA(Sec) kinase [Plasmodium brasilianum]|uniref:L-seryl-tRNA(Sec) kinase n=1 Tax=Plasmodium brasilianum TaxID=5824 RepID=A0ACB9YFJ6_PLABR|nr:L-seryl-tRNA(Sec) kinase [Plasmodium brasilianum]